MSVFREVAAVPVVDPARARVYAEGWQSWSPTTAYRLDEAQYRPGDANRAVMCYRGHWPPAKGGWHGEGLLAVDAGDGSTVVVAAADPAVAVPAIRAERREGSLVVSSDGDVRVRTGLDGLPASLAAWADGLVRAAGVPAPRPSPTLWCSWYQYFTRVTEADVEENLAVMDLLDLPVDVVQVDDGYQAEIGDWLTLSGRFASLRDLAARIRDAGRGVGIWTAPLLVGSRSAVASEHPEWLVGGASAGHHWDQDLHVLDVTHPGAVDWLVRVFSTFRSYGIDLFKIDFLYAGAIAGRRHQDATPVAAYREALRLIREGVGSDAVILGCGAPVLPSIGLVDAMRVSPDTDPSYEPAGGDMSQPSVRGAMLTGDARSWQHGRFWVNDPDCLLARPGVERREEWAAHVERVGGLRGSSDRLADLDEWGLRSTRRLLAPVPVDPFVAAGRLR